MAKEQLGEIGLAAACRADQEIVAFGRKFLGWDLIEEEVAKALDVSIGHQRHGALGAALIDIAVAF